jgi:hypothetical protein
MTRSIEMEFFETEANQLDPTSLKEVWWLIEAERVRSYEDFHDSCRKYSLDHEIFILRRERVRNMLQRRRVIRDRLIKIGQWPVGVSEMSDQALQK